MYSAVLFTDEIDDLDRAVDELVRQFADVKLCKNSAGLVFAHPDTDLSMLGQRLKERLGLPVIGATTLLMFTMQGMKQEGISLHIFTGDDCNFSVGCTEDLTTENIEAEVSELYKRLTEGVPADEVKLLLAYGSPKEGLLGDDFLDVLNDVCADVPVYGGMASDNFNVKECKVFCNNVVRKYGLALMLITGNVKPITHYSCDVEATIDYEGTVTEVSGNHVMKLDGKPFIEALSATGINFDGEGAACDYVSTPFLVSYMSDTGEKIEILRHIASVDTSNGSGLFFGRVPLGAKIKIGIVTRESIHDSVAGVSLRSLESVSKVLDYKYSVLLVTSCASRMMSYTNVVDKEAGAYIKIIPEGMNMSGFYAFGEMCPATTENDTGMRNVFHNTTFAMLVM